MRTAVATLAVLVALAAPARADKTADVTAVIKKHVAALATGNDKDFVATLGADPVVFTPSGTTHHVPAPTAGSRDAFAVLYGLAEGKATHKLGKVTVQIDDAHHVAWFHGAFDASFKSTGANPCGGAPGGTATSRMRFGGIAVDDKGWKIVAIAFGKPMSEADVVAEAKQLGAKLPTRDALVTGDKPFAAAVRAWLPAGLAAAKAPAPAALALAPGVTDPATGDAATQLAAAWDKLGLVVVGLDAYTYASGAAGFAVAEVAMPIAHTPNAAHLTLVVTATKTGDTWQWTSLQLTPIAATMLF